jgi:hypothetical protein
MNVAFSKIRWLWNKWKNRHRHVYVQRSFLAGEKWRSPAYLVEHKCECGKTFYTLATVLGVDHVNQAWASCYFNRWNPK